jgi:hypothetical protein
MKFTDLEFEPHPDFKGVQAVKFFDNGYGVSVIMSPYSYGGPDGLYEIAVLQGLEEKWEICYDTPITDDVMGYLTREDVETVLNQVKELK